MAISCLSLTPPPTLPSLSISNPKLKLSLHNTNNSPPPLTSPLSLSTRIRLKEGVNGKRKLQVWRILAAPEESLASDATTAIETSQQIISSGDDGVDTIISTLLIIAFVALSILTVGVIYIAVTDFLQKREREKFEKEEGSKKKKDGKKKKVRAKGRPRGFGQKIKDDDEEDAIDVD